ncbi:hypothetical protein FB567DRAFT_521735 [Paraphoma chrysanthemicola]|uniref:Uncharacterized protein n=1 Tax=Paraphoma chrysanthemicola TaxID=798071 RepID=A0A8K0W0R1_9PLEO|nr:hypothetical protein FB567DRAFT_521735 [Paraphoma chrysanthemicola]
MPQFSRALYETSRDIESQRPDEYLRDDRPFVFTWVGKLIYLIALYLSCGFFFYVVTCTFEGGYATGVGLALCVCMVMLTMLIVLPGTVAWE